MTKHCPQTLDAVGIAPDWPDPDVLLEDQRAGRSLQEHVRPRSGTQLEGIRFEHRIVPALELSGDALDFFQLADGRILAYLLDVSGHGTAAALLSMFIKSTVRHSLVMHPAVTAASVLADVNQALLDAGMRKYGTMICLLFSPAASLLQWSYAGHTPRPVLWLPGQTPQLLEGQGQPVGVFADALYVNQQLQLPASFALCLCSDGILDALPGDDLVSREAALLEQVQTAGGRFSALAQALLVPDAQPDDRSIFVISRSVDE
ncbi:MAG: serine/threonine-protein phosphatase [Thiopseudomonas sp.]|nr:serine/threonine-protein phosphatase [Thiopseudomonas sp.]